MFIAKMILWNANLWTCTFSFRLKSGKCRRKWNWQMQQIVFQWQKIQKKKKTWIEFINSVYLQYPQWIFMNAGTFSFFNLMHVPSMTFARLVVSQTVLKSKLKKSAAEQKNRYNENWKVGKCFEDTTPLNTASICTNVKQFSTEYVIYYRREGMWNYRHTWKWCMQNRWNCHNF